MENHQDRPLSAAPAARKVVFGEYLHGPHKRLYSELVGYDTDGHLFIWKRVLQCADDQLLEDILDSLRQGSEIRNALLVSAVCSGYDGMGKPIGKNGLLKRSARRFAYHALATVDLACELEGIREKSLNGSSLRHYRGTLTNIRNGFSWLTPPSKAHGTGALTEAESRLAKAFVVTKGTQRDDAMEQGIHFLAEHYDEMESYFPLIHSSAESNTLSGVHALLATKPEMALASGAL